MIRFFFGGGMWTQTLTLPWAPYAAQSAFLLFLKYMSFYWASKVGRTVLLTVKCARFVSVAALSRGEGAGLTEEWLSFKNSSLLHHSSNRCSSRGSSSGYETWLVTEISNGTEGRCYLNRGGRQKVPRKKKERNRDTSKVGATRFSVDVGVWTRIPAENNPGECSSSLRGC